jgi:hypothetical protein
MTAVFSAHSEASLASSTVTGRFDPIASLSSDIITPQSASRKAQAFGEGAGFSPL